MEPRDAASDETLDATRVGETIGEKYALKRLLGSGGMGAVYEAENTWIHRRVAIKLMRTEVARSDEAVRRFFQEAQTATALAHPNIVEILDMGQDRNDGTLFIVMEFLAGEDLRQRLDRGPVMGVQEAMEAILPIMDALVEVHRSKVIHRDIKPENIFLTRNKVGSLVPKIIDFGISKVTATEHALVRTRTGAMPGTPYYMSPEQARGDETIDARSDVWSVAAVLFEMLSGQRPFTAPNYNRLMLRIMTETAPRLDSVAPGLPVALADVLQRGLERTLERRYESMQQFVSDLRKLTETSGTQKPEKEAPTPPADDAGSVPQNLAFHEEPTNVKPPVTGTSAQPIARATPPAATAMTWNRLESPSSGPSPTSKLPWVLASLVVLMATSLAALIGALVGRRATALPASQQEAVTTPTPPRAEPPQLLPLDAAGPSRPTESVATTAAQATKTTTIPRPASRRTNVTATPRSTTTPQTQSQGQAPSPPGRMTVHRRYP